LEDCPIWSLDSLQKIPSRWITPEIKRAIKRNQRVYRKWNTRGRKPEGRENVKSIQNLTSHLIRVAKDSYIANLAKKLCDSRRGSKIFWTAFKRLINKKKNTNIPPLIENGVFVTDFNQKSNIFNTYFAQQCHPLQNNSVLANFSLLTNASLCSIEVHHEDITKIIQKLNPKKSHGIDNISIAMLQICPQALSIPLKILFDRCMREGSFPGIWKRANVQPVHKKESKQSKTQYRPISLLPICGKIFEKIIFDQMYVFLNSNNLISQNPSGFGHGDSTINQLLSISTEIYEAYENYEETRAVFLNISKAFDKVWHEGLIFKLKEN
jgi:hypothetical protein